jgi:hypothetical protein
VGSGEQRPRPSNQAMIEISPRFAGEPPVSCDFQRRALGALPQSNHLKAPAEARLGSRNSRLIREGSRARETFELAAPSARRVTLAAIFPSLTHVARQCTVIGRVSCGTWTPAEAVHGKANRARGESG